MTFGMRMKQLREAGARDARLGLPIDNYYKLGLPSYKESYRAAYEQGWRCEKEEMRKAARKENKEPVQVTFQMTNPHNVTPGILGERITLYLENVEEASVDHMSVRHGLPIGARRLPTGQIEPLWARLQFILDFLSDADEAGNGGEEMDSAMMELHKLLTDVKKAEGVE